MIDSVEKEKEIRINKNDLFKFSFINVEFLVDVIFEFISRQKQVYLMLQMKVL